MTSDIGSFSFTIGAPHIIRHGSDHRSHSCLHPQTASAHEEVTAEHIVADRYCRYNHKGRQDRAEDCHQCSGNPQQLVPSTTMAPLTAIAPGEDWAIATRSSISSSPIQWYSSTNFFFISVTMT